MHHLKTWDTVKVINEKLEAFGRAGVVGDLKDHKPDEVPVKLDGDDDETVFAVADVKVL